jgi:Na+/proline symporter
VVLSSLVLITSFGPWALPQMVQKFYSIRSKADVSRATTIAGIFALFMSFGAYFCGAMTHLFYAKLPKAVIIAGHPNLDYLMPVFLTDKATHLPLLLVLIILLMVFSASMSSLSSLVLVSSSAIAIDIYGAFVNKQAYQKHTTTLMRVLCALFVLASLLIAVRQFDVIVNLMVIAWSTIAGAFLAPFIYGLFWKRTTTVGAFAGMISGVTTSVILFVLWGAPNIPVAGAIAMVVPMIVTPLVSLMTPPLSKALIDAAFNDKEVVKEEAV